MIKTDDSVQLRLNGLHAGTVLRERHIGNGVMEQWHEHPQTGEVVIVHTWAVQDGDCISKEAEVTNVYHKQKGLVNCILALEAIHSAVQKL